MIDSTIDPFTPRPRPLPTQPSGTFGKASSASYDPRPEPAERSTPTPLPDELQAVQAFPLEALPETVRPWVRDVCERMQCPADFVAVPLLVALSSLVAGKVAIRPQAHTDWQESANLWAAIVGRPGRMKSPCMTQALANLRKLETKHADLHAEAMRDHELDMRAFKLANSAADKKAAQALSKDSKANITDLLMTEELQTPIRKRYVVTDIGYEALGEVLAENPQGVMMERDELRGLLVHLAREENATARGFMLQAWSGGSYQFGRIGRGHIAIPNMCLSMIGGIQPGPLSEFIKVANRGGGGDDGFLQRCLIAWPDGAGDYREVDRGIDEAAKIKAAHVFASLDKLDGAAAMATQAVDADGKPDGLPYLRFSDDALAMFNEWRHELEAAVRAPDIRPSIEAALSKFRKHVPAMALTLHLASGGTGPVTARACASALELADYFKSHAIRAYESGTNATVATAKAIIRRIERKELAEVFTARDVYRRGWAGLSDREGVCEALDMLAAHGWLTESERRSDAAGGRVTVDYRATRWQS
ncbi:YfjI family protein [Paucibacter sp. DJ2R-2]|uniref:YfjI family protein n=1 Tax=Paucibacter sp. DJ2R-2 TaxID=2893558 RepID=UPI0021E3593D|nr:YfjI family protein [Paucibacter sp. DJ2R-2]MCV2423465.1 DUF3987 domain-containing protein [Paucibacter sp. DJ4R-1]MCV2441342.1 DUF3987 domain-containing protein [Paucibacter sp. DJ2R-2]